MNSDEETFRELLENADSSGEYARRLAADTWGASGPPDVSKLSEIGRLYPDWSAFLFRQWSVARDAGLVMPHVWRRDALAKNRAVLSGRDPSEAVEFLPADRVGIPEDPVKTTKPSPYRRTGRTTHRIVKLLTRLRFSDNTSPAVAIYAGSHVIADFLRATVEDLLSESGLRDVREKLSRGHVETAYRSYRHREIIVRSDFVLEDHAVP